MRVVGKRWAIAGAVGVGLYAGFGFWGVSALVASQFAKFAAQAGREGTVAAVRFNPFTLRLEATQLRLRERDGGELAAIEGLVVEPQWRSVVRGAWSFAEITLRQPVLAARIAPDGTFNLARLVADLQGAPQPPEASAPLPRVIVEHLAVEDARVDFDDRRAGYRNTFAPITFRLDDFSTLPGRDDQHVFTARSERGGSLRWTGKASLQPLRASGEFVLQDASLPEVAVYLKPWLPAKVAAGRLDATLPYTLAYENGHAQASLPGARVTLRDLALEQPGDAPLRIEAPAVSLQATVTARQDGAALQAQVAGAQLQVERLALSQDGRAPVKLAKFAVGGGRLDLAARQAAVDTVRVDGAQVELRRGADGSIDLLRMLAIAGPASPTGPQPASAPWSFEAGEIAVAQSAARLADAASGVEVQVQDIALAVKGVGSDLARPVRFEGGLALQSGGRLTAKGQAVPATGALEGDLDLRGLALRPLQPLLAQYVRLDLAGGSVSARGRLVGRGSAVPADRRTPAWQYDGGLHVNDLVMNEDDGNTFLAWKDVGSDRLRATVEPNRLEVPELRVAGAQAKLIIEDDRSFNAARLLVKRPPADPVAAAPAPAASSSEPFPVRIRRVRLQDAKLDFTDLSLRPQFAAKVYELGGAINGLSTQADTRAQIELDGRVDEFGMARVRGEINPFSPRNSTDIQATFRNVDMVPASPYSMKFAGYRLAEGKISLDLNYRIQNAKLEGHNRIVIDRLTLGERVDSPDALKIPLQLAIAILKDSDGRIDLGLPVSGNIDDPQFSYGAVVWKAIANLLTGVVTAPFRALGSMLGVGGEQVGAIEFDPGSARLLPPEREKLRHVAEILAKRSQLKITVPAAYSTTADTAALRRRGLRLDVAQKAGLPLAPGEEPGPIDASDRAVRAALRDLFAQRFGKGELEKEVTAIERAAATPSAAASSPGALPIWQRVGKYVQGEPQVANANGFYATLQRRLEEAQPVAADVLTKLGEQRAAVIVEALAAAGVGAERVGPGAAATVEPKGLAVPVGLELGAK